MAKSAFLTENELSVIREEFLKDRAAPAKALKDAVDKRLSRSLALSTIQREKAKLGKRHAQIQASPEERPWHLGVTRTNPLSAETIARVLKLKTWLQRTVKSRWLEVTTFHPDYFDEFDAEARHDTITVREVFWIDKLRVAIPDDKSLWKAVVMYCMAEKLADLAGKTTFDTTYLDEWVSSGMPPTMDLIKAMGIDG